MSLEHHPEAVSSRSQTCREGPLLARSRGRPFAVLATVLLTVSLAGCASVPSAEEEALAIRQLSDLALLQEIHNTDLRLAQLGVSAQYLALTRPAPVYTLTGTGFYTGSFWSYGNVGRFTFQGQSIYQLTPDYSAQFGYALGQAIIAARINRTLRYRTALLNEAMARIARREADSRTSVENFYQVHSDLVGHEAVVAAIAPWIQRENPGLQTSELLNAIASRARGSIRASRHTLSGDWYGLIVEEITYPDGSKAPFWSFGRVRLVQSGESLVGVGDLFDGQQVTLSTRITGTRLEGQVVNTTFNLAFDITGEFTDDSLVADFRSEVQGTTFVGRAVMVR